MGLAGGIDSYAYVNDSPSTLVDPLGLCKIYMRFTLHFFLGAAWNHTFLETVEPTGETLFFRGGPERFPLLGNLVTVHGPLLSNADIRGDVETFYSERVSDRETYVLLDDGLPCDCYNASFGMTLGEINRAHHSYNLLGFNSNYSAYRAAYLAGLNPPPPPGFTPGWLLYKQPLPIEIPRLSAPH